MGERAAIEVKAGALEVVPTGITGLDKVIRGFIKGRIYLVAGETGTGKTIFSLNFLIGGVRRGEPGVYVLIDERVEDLLAGAKAFGWDLERLIDQDMLSVMTLLPEFSEKFKEKTIEATARSIARDIGTEVRRIGAKRLVIDPIAPLVSGEKDMVRVREYVRELMFRIEQEVGTTTVVTSEIPTGTAALSRFGVEEFLASGIIVLGIRREINRYVRTMFIRKMWWLPVHPSVYRFEIVPRVGIVVKERIW